MNSAEGLKDEEACVLNEVLQASNQEEVIHKNLRDRKKFMLEHCTTGIKAMLISINLGHWPKIHTTLSLDQTEWKVMSAALQVSICLPLLFNVLCNKGEKNSVHLSPIPTWFLL